jgi:hypothetical protein
MQPGKAFVASGRADQLERLDLQHYNPASHAQANIIGTDLECRAPVVPADRGGQRFHVDRFRGSECRVHKLPIARGQLPGVSINNRQFLAELDLGAADGAKPVKAGPLRATGGNEIVNGLSESDRAS